jgi:ABC-type multidrug transport system fused ATPase/permease subunit
MIGPSGSGKSTVVGLVEKWYGVDDGFIRVGLTMLGDVPAEELRG